MKINVTHERYEHTEMSPLDTQSAAKN